MTTRLSSGKFAATAIAAFVGFAMAACGSNSSQDSQNTGKSTPSTSAAAGPARTGDALTNPACALPDITDVEAATGQKITEINGTRTHGQFVNDSHNCFWIADPDDGPWVVAVNLEDGLGGARASAIDHIRAPVNNGFGALVEGVGDVASSGSGAVHAVAGEQYVVVQVSSRDLGADPEDLTEQAVRLARAALAGH